MPATHFSSKTHAIVRLFSLLLHHHRFAAFRHRRTGHNTNAGTRRPFTMVWLTGKGFTGNGQRLPGGNIG
ncbi:Uncharacterised protein [Shigella flexneri]|nr:Uncharacterised protein [Shigella flexneri]